MGKPFSIKNLSALAVALLLLGHLSPVAAGVLLCIGDDAEADCCAKPHAAQDAPVLESWELQDGSDCDCCITVHAAPATAGASAHKASFDVAAGVGRLRDAVTSDGTRTHRESCRDPGNKGLSSLRTIVLLV